MQCIAHRELVEPPRQRGIGIITPFDFALDRELWRWTPEDVSLHVTRLPTSARRFTLATAKALADRVAVEQATRDLLTPGPEVVAYTCAAGSFVHGADGCCGLRQAMVAAGAPAACTTSGALVDELHALGVSRLAVVTPYTSSLTRRLVDFLTEHAIDTVRTTAFGPLARADRAARSEAIERLCAREDVEAVFICCTNVPTYDLFATAVGKPVLTANEVLMRAALHAVGRQPVDGGAEPARARPPAAPAASR